MAFIPIDAKADVQGSKKGKITPEQHAQLNAFCLSNKSGILNCLDRCEATYMTYPAVGGVATVVLRKGYVVICGRLIECEEGTEIKVSSTNSGYTGKIILRCNLASFGDGEFVVDTTITNLQQDDLNINTNGVYELELYSYTSDGTNITLLPRTNPYVDDMQNIIEDLKRKHQVVFLGDENQLVDANGKWTDLGQSCFFFSISSDNFSVKGLAIPKYSKGYWICTDNADIQIVFNTLNGRVSRSFYFNYPQNEWFEIGSYGAMYASTASGIDTSKGTIEERLTRLGFNSGIISFLGVAYGSGANTNTALTGIYRQGNYVIGKLRTSFFVTPEIIENYFSTEASDNLIVEISDVFRPKNMEILFIYALRTDGRFKIIWLDLYSDGKGYMDKGYSHSWFTSPGNLNSDTGDWTFYMTFGYEAEPIK